MTKAEAVAFLGSELKLAAELQVSGSNVSAWTDIPRLRQFQLEVQTDGALKADRSPMPIRRHKRGAGRPKKAPEKAIAAPQSVAVPIKPSDTIPLRWWATEPGIMAAGKALGLEANRGESWASYTERLRDQLSRR